MELKMLVRVQNIGQICKIFIHTHLSGCRVDSNADPRKILGIFQGLIMNVKP